MANNNNPRLATSVSIVGPGRLGQALAIALNQAGYTIRSIVARRAGKAEKAVGLLRPTSESTIQALNLSRLGEMSPSDLILITTPDDAIREIVDRLDKTQAASSRKSTILHTSGALSSEILSPLARLGFHTGSLHPLVSVSDPFSGAKSLRGAFFCVEGDQAAAKMARRIVRDLGGKSFSVDAVHKPLYHAAALTAAGHLTALIDLAIEMLVSCGLKPKEAQMVLMPLVESAVNNLKSSTPDKALTGTFARGDLATVKRHLAALSRQPNQDALKIYKLLGLRSLRLANKKGIDAGVLKEIEKLLS